MNNILIYIVKTCYNILKSVKLGRVNHFAYAWKPDSTSNKVFTPRDRMVKGGKKTRQKG